MNLTSSPALLAHQTQQAEWARVWHGLSVDARTGFQTLANGTMPRRKNGKPRMSAFFLFATINTALTNAGKQPITVPPSTLVVPPSLPLPLTLVSVATPGHFSLTLSASMGYPDAVTIYAAPPCLAGTNIYRDSAFKVIGSLQGLVTDGEDIASMYARAFRAPMSGEKVAIKVVGVSSTGNATTKFFAASVTGSAALSSIGVDDTELEMAA